MIPRMRSAVLMRYPNEISPAVKTGSHPIITIEPTKFGHPYYPNPVIYADGIEIAWPKPPFARESAEFYRAHPEHARALIELWTTEEED